MNILLTGASGFLGKALVSELKSHGLNFQSIRHGEPLGSVDWQPITHVINAAAVIPQKGVTTEDYWDGNVVFVEKMLPFCAGKQVIHFSTLSRFYKFEAYQISKGIGCELLLANRPMFDDLQIVYLPTLEDKQLIATIADKADKGDMPTVDELIYAYCSVEQVAQTVVSALVENTEIKLEIEPRNLLTQVLQRVDSEQVKPGKLIDRTCLNQGIFRTHSSLTLTIRDLV